MNLYALTISFLILFFPAKSNSADKNDGEAAWKSEMLKAMNEIRTEGCRCPDGRYYAPATSLVWSEKLNHAAQGHAEDMDKRGYFDHRSKNGKTFDQRISDAGYRWKAVGENIAWGYSDARSVVLGWRKSKGHCKNLMNPAYSEMGVGLSGDFWVQDLASPKP